METKKGYVEVDHMPEMDTSELREVSLPPHPKPIREWTEKDVRYNQDPLDFEKRIAQKLYSVWVMWASVISNQHLNDFLEKECETNTPAFESKCIIIDMVDQLGKCLADTDILEELAWLTASEKEKVVELARQKRSATTSSPDVPSADPNTENQ